MVRINASMKKSETGRSSRPQMFLIIKSVLKLSCKFTGEHTCRSVISIKLLRNLIEITLWHGRSAVNLLHFLITLFPKNANGRLPLSSKTIIIEIES